MQIFISIFKVGKLSSVYVLAHSGFVSRCCPMVDSQLILELLFLYRRVGCSLTVLLFFLMLMGTCFFILSTSLCGASYVPSFTSA